MWRLRLRSTFAAMEQLRSWKHPKEVYALLRYKLKTGGRTHSKDEVSKGAHSQIKKCYEYLDGTSRTFGLATQSLDDELRDAVCILYLVLRALDTVEDDMTIPYDEKMTLLPKFYTFLEDPSWNYTKSADRYRIVLEDFTTISSQFRQLKPIFRDIISDVCRLMGTDMTVYLTKSPGSIKEWEEYCHYVCGRVVVGLSQLFSAVGFEDRLMSEDSALSDLMGIYLQKSNIIRDYLDDVTSGHPLWPQEVWSKYSRELIELSEPERIDDAISCLNELITNALLHIPDVMKYLSRIQNQSIFNFFAILQVMSVATLERCYNNRQVFRGRVKIRKGEAVRLMIQALDLDKVKAINICYLKQIENRIPSSDPSADVTRKVIQAALNSCETSQVYSSATAFYTYMYMYLPIFLSFATLFAAASYQIFVAL